jgi:hypothetical protein
MAYSVALGCHDRQISDEVSANMQGAVLVDDRVGIGTEPLTTVAQLTTSALSPPA